MAWASLRYWTIFFSDWVMNDSRARRFASFPGLPVRAAPTRDPRRAGGPRAQPIFSEETKFVYCGGCRLHVGPAGDELQLEHAPLARITRANTVPLLPFWSAAFAIRASRAGKPW